MNIKSKFAISICTGFLIWAICSFFLNTEPWDSKYGYVTVGLIGLILGLSWPEKPWLWPIGHYLGQFLYWSIGLTRYVLFSNGESTNFFILLTLGMISLTVFCSPSLFMSLVGGVIIKFVKKSSH